ncbi:mannose-ethanolamine phosphotransferase gpi13 [Coelomomyces lativittatus]|nr:mannose-ethanolamine phosphotransferase gpi13 [Coelomomyces lativittatus]
MLVTWLTYQVQVCRDEDKDCVNTWSNSRILSLFCGLSLLFVSKTWLTRLNFLFILMYWLVEEEFLNFERTWSVYFARFQLFWTFLSLIFKWLPCRLAYLFLLVQLHRPASTLSLVAFYLFPKFPLPMFSFPIKSNSKRTPNKKDIHLIEKEEDEDFIGAHFLIRTVFFATGHQATIPSIQWSSGLVALHSSHLFLSGCFVLLNSIGHIGLSRKFSWKLLCLEIWHLVCSSLSVLHLRRHLMVWKIFCPRWILSVLFCCFLLFSTIVYKLISLKKKS